MSKISKTYDITRSEFAQNFLYLNGQPFSLDDYPHMRAVYDCNAKTSVMMFSRQTAKSTTMANIMISNAVMIPYFKTLYIAPTVEQTKVFSHDRVTPVLESSPLISEHYLNSTLVQNVHMKQLLNGSRMYLRYALLNADRIRGFSADMNIFDETQDLRRDIIPVIKETMSRSLYKMTMFAGTPKRSKGTLAELWKLSTRNEYIVKCDHCGKWNILDERNIGLKGVICKNCGKEPNLRKGQWVSSYSETQAPIMEGFRVCALHFANAPWVNWKNDILIKKQTASRAIFHNETLALEYDDGVSPITEMELQAQCNYNRIMTVEPDELDKSYKGVMGADYGPANSDNSNTVIVVVQRRPDKYVVVFMKKFLGKESDYAFIHREIPRLMDVWNCSHLAADYGMGEAANSEIRSRVGFERVVAFQHEYNQKEVMKWNDKMPAFTLNRNKVMQELFHGIKRGVVEFPQWSYTQPFAEDILNIHLETNEDENKTSFGNSGPDDTFHALLYAILSLDKIYGNSLLFTYTNSQ